MTESNPTPTEAPQASESSTPSRVLFDAPKHVEGSERKAVYDRTEGRFVTAPGEAGKDAPKYDKVKGHTYATVRV